MPCVMKSVHAARTNDIGDDLWKLLEDEYLEEVKELQELGAEMRARVESGDCPTKKEVALALMCTLAYGEIAKRKFARLGSPDLGKALGS